MTLVRILLVWRGRYPPKKKPQTIQSQVTPRGVSICHVEIDKLSYYSSLLSSSTQTNATWFQKNFSD